MNIIDFVKKIQNMIDNEEVSACADVAVRTPYLNSEFCHDQFDFDFEVYHAKYEENDILYIIPDTLELE
jgi:hypothetical protein